MDTGVEGCAALLDTDAQDLTFHDLHLTSDRRLDARWLFDLLLEFTPDLVVTEFTFQPLSLVQMTGAVVAVGQILQADVEVVAVTKWKRLMLGQNTKNKTVSIQCVKQLWPGVGTQLRKTPRARTDSPDRAEAALLALYGQRSRSPKSSGSG